jgi:transcriptional regulator with XRE-family HTH domain
LHAGDVTRRGRRGPGVPIIPSRVRQARIERGLSLADLAGIEVSRDFIHQLEQGLARPSIGVLEVIAHRTGKPLEYFTTGEFQATRGPDLSSDLIATSKRLERLASTLDLSDANREALRMIVNSLRHGARVIAAIAREREGRRRGARETGPER